MTDEQVDDGNAETVAPSSGQDGPVDSRTTVRRYSIDDGEALGDAVLAALPLEVDGGHDRPPLYSAVDLERVESLFESRLDGYCEISFTYEEFDVTVTDGEVVVSRSGPAASF